MFKHTTAIKKLRRLKSRTKIVQGSSSAGKTYGILAILIDRATKTDKLEISVVSETIPHLRRGAMKDFLKLMVWTNRFNEAHWNKTLLTYTFANGSYIEFFSADQETKIRGARRDILYINECNNIQFETYHQLSIRTNKEIWLDYNPSSEFWAHTELKGEVDTDFIIITYQDNEALDKAIVKEIEKAKVKGETSDYWRNWYQVYGLGQLGQVQGTIFTNWHQIDNVPTDAKYIGMGLDFGYSNDPTAIVMVYKWNNEYILDEIAYQKELSNKAIADILKPYGGTIVCDSAEPKSIDELRSYGLNAIKCDKKNGINYGIQKVQALDKFYVTKRSTNMIKELRGYVWNTDKTGKSINEPIGFNNHMIDAIRYILSHVIVSPNYGKYHLR